MPRFVALALLLLALPLRLAQAQTGALIGLVVDLEGRPVASATISLTASSDSVATGTTRTDASGRFAFGQLPPGEYEVLVRGVGYTPAQTSVTVTAGETLEIVRTLASNKPVLDTVRARGSQNSCNNLTLNGFECRRQAGVGYYRNAAEIAALKPNTRYDLFRGLPGIRMDLFFGPAVRPSRCLKILVNGRPPIPKIATLEDIVGIEYYDSWQKVPLDYRQIANIGSCDLIVYWMSDAFSRD